MIEQGQQNIKQYAAYWITPGESRMWGNSVQLARLPLWRRITAAWITLPQRCCTSNTQLWKQGTQTKSAISQHSSSSSYHFVICFLHRLLLAAIHFNANRKSCSSSQKKLIVTFPKAKKGKASVRKQVEPANYSSCWNNSVSEQKLLYQYYITVRFQVTCMNWWWWQISWSLIIRLKWSQKHWVKDIELESRQMKK